MRTPAMLMAVALLGGCAEDDDVACEHVLCDVTSPACVARTAEVVACDLGMDPAQPSVRYLTREEVLAEWQAGVEPLSDEQAQDLADYRRGQALLGHMPPSYEEAELQADLLAGVTAYYTREPAEIVIIDEGPSKDRGAYQTLVHELVHFYQDRRYDLGALYETHAGTFPRALALRALVEGDAAFRDDVAGLELEGLTPNDVDWRGYFDEWQSGVLELARDSQTPAVDIYALFPYAQGSELVYDAWRVGGDEEIAALFAQPPTSVRQVMSGYSAWPDQLPNGDEALAAASVPVLPDDYLLLGGGSQSVWMIQATLSRTVKDALWYPELTWVPTELLTIHRHEPTSGIAALWRIRSTEAAQLEGLLDSGLWQAAEDAGEGRLVYTDVGGDLVLVAVSEELDARAVLGEVTGWQSPEQAASMGDSANASSAIRRRFPAIACPSHALPR